MWKLLFGELQACEGRQQVLDSYASQDGGQESEEGLDLETREDERSWRDPSAHKFREAVFRWLEDGYAESQLIKVML